MAGTRKSWFLPETPDVIRLLGEQAAATSEGMDAFTSWAGGGDVDGDELDRYEHDADELKRQLRDTLRSAFMTPFDPEDVYALSHGMDEILNGAKNTVREAEVMDVEPDAAMASMAELLQEGVGKLRVALSHLGDDHDAATGAADAAIKSQRRLERAYRSAMSDLLQVDDLREVTARRELYRRLSRISDQLVAVAERVWYSVVKEA